jgi:HAD superfamily hydrolase (TIGR01509 family)
MKIRLYLYHILITIALSCSFIAAETFIFDLGGVLVDTNKHASFKHMGVINIAQYGFHLKINPFNLSAQIKMTFFKILDHVAELYNLDTYNTLLCAYDEHGNSLPYLMRAWLQGTMTCHEIRILIKRAIDLHPEWFIHKAEQRIIENLIKMVFTPEQFVATRKIYPAGIKFIKKCKHHGHQVYALSNWDCESFELLKKKYPQLFDLFDGIIISGDINALKPHASIYQALLERYNLDPKHCWFIDDQKENVHAAQELGINGILHTSCFKKLTQNIKDTYSKSVIRRENLNNMGIIVSSTKNTSNAIIDGENISLTDSTKYSCLPANA